MYYKINDVSSLQLWCKNKLSQIESSIPEMVIQRGGKNLNSKGDSEKEKKKVTDETV